MAESAQESESTPVEHSVYPSPPLDINSELDASHLCSLDNSATTCDTAIDVADSQEDTPDTENSHAISTESSHGSFNEYRYAYALQELSSGASRLSNQEDIPTQPVHNVNSPQMHHTQQPIYIAQPLIPGVPLVQRPIHGGPQESLCYRQYIATQQTSPSSNLFPLINSSQSHSSPEIPYMAYYHTGPSFDPQTPTTSISIRHRPPMAYAGPYPQPGNIPNQGPVSLPSDNWSTQTRSSSKRPRRSQQPKHQCYICGKFLLRPSSLETHLRSHNGLKPFQCPVKTCKRHVDGNWFSVKSNMTRHLKSCHTGYVPPVATEEGTESWLPENTFEKTTEA